jgi:hypothetical protein
MAATRRPKTVKKAPHPQDPKEFKDFLGHATLAVAKEAHNLMEIGKRDNFFDALVDAAERVRHRYASGKCSICGQPAFGTGKCMDRHSRGRSCT